MKAILWTRYGPPEVLQSADMDRPEPAADELLIKVAAANIFTGDAEMRRFKMHPSLWLPIRLFMGLFKPRIPIIGQEMSGTVVACGEKVMNFKSGDQVFGSTGSRFGAYAEYVALPASYPLVHKPPQVSHRDASTIAIGGQHALHFLRLARLQAGEKILIIGACGCIGTYAIQLARLWGAEVTAVDRADKLDVLRDCGADHVIDYEKEDYLGGDSKYHVIFDVVGSSPYRASLACLHAGGRYVLANVGLFPMLRAAWTNRSSHYQVIFHLARANREDLQEIVDLLVNGKLKAIIDRSYPLTEVVEAHRYIDAGSKKGHVVLLCEDHDLDTS